MAGREKTPNSKVARLIEKYGLEGVSEELEDRWTRSEDRWGLRSLVEDFNTRLLAAAIDAQSPTPQDVAVDTLYRNLTDEDVSSGVRIQTKTRLEQQGVDVDQLTTDFVSRQAMHTYLSSVRGATPPDTDESSEDRRNNKADVIERLRQRLAAVTEQSISELANGGHLTIGQFNVLVRVQVHCSDCATQVSVSEILSNGGCECESPTVTGTAK